MGTSPFIACIFVLCLFSAGCSSEEGGTFCTCIDDLDCPERHLCEECECRLDESCDRNEDCSWGACLECIRGQCVSYACRSQEECDPYGCCLPNEDGGCNVCWYLRGCANRCGDPESPLYVDCGESFVAQTYGPCCDQCRCVSDLPCGGFCPDGQYCCRQTQTCDPVPTACDGVECPPGEQVNPDPGGTLNEETCQIEGADCSCVPR